MNNVPKKLKEKWACEFHHGVLNFQDSGDLNKEINLWHVLNKASPSQLLAVSKVVNYLQKRDYLNKKYGEVIPL